MNLKASEIMTTTTRQHSLKKDDNTGSNNHTAEYYIALKSHIQQNSPKLLNMKADIALTSGISLSSKAKMM